MKMIPAEDLAIIIMKEFSGDDCSENDIKDIFEEFGDTWFYADGSFKKLYENEARKEYINKRRS